MGSRGHASIPPRYARVHVVDGKLASICAVCAGPPQWAATREEAEKHHDLSADYEQNLQTRLVRIEGTGKRAVFVLAD